MEDFGIPTKISVLGHSRSKQFSKKLCKKGVEDSGIPTKINSYDIPNPAKIYDESVEEFQILTVCSKSLKMCGRFWNSNQNQHCKSFQILTKSDRKCERFGNSNHNQQVKSSQVQTIFRKCMRIANNFRI